MTCRRTYARRRAFTLPEVLATLLLMAIVLPVVGSAITNSLAAASYARNLAQAASLAEAKLSEIVVLKQWSTGSLSGDFGTQYPLFRWTATTTARDFGVTEVVMEVRWNERGVEKWCTVSTVAFDTESSSSSVSLP